MFSDICIIARKEWKEYLTGQGLKGGLMNLVVMVIVFGVFLPAQFGKSFVESPINLLFWSWVPAFLVIAAVADSFAGERERHTLETLLASRLSDRAILLGKIVAIVSYGWGLTVLCLVLGLVTINLIHGRSTLVLPPLDLGAAVVILSFLVAAVTAGIGVVLSIKAGSMRQVYQAMSMTWMLLIFGLSFGAKAVLDRLPQQTARAIVQGVRAMGAPENRGTLILGVSLLLGGVTLVLYSVAEKRFRRLRCLPK